MGAGGGPIFQVLGRWAARSPGHDPMRPFSAVSLLLSLRTMIDLSRTVDLAARFGFVIGDDTFHLILDHGAIAIGRGLPELADVTFTGATHAVAAAVHNGAPLDDLTAAGLLTIAGDRGLAQRFTTLFPMPEKLTSP